MRWMLRLAIGVAVLWALAWVAGAHLTKTRAEAWFAEQQAKGLVAEHGGISVAGFATRFDLTIQAPHLAETGFDWQAPYAKIYAMAWKPWHVIAALPGGQELTVAGQRLTLDTPMIQASLRMEPRSGLPPREAVVEWDKLSVTSERGWAVSTGRVLGAAEATPDQALRLWAQADQVTLPQGSDMGGLGPVIESFRFDARLPLAAPLEWDGDAAIEGVEVRTLDLTWGTLDLEGSGTLSADPQGQAEGEIALKIRGWRALPDLAIDLGLILPGMRGGLMGAFEGLAKAGTDPEELVLPLRFAGGVVSLGPIPLGPAPYLQ